MTDLTAESAKYEWPEAVIEKIQDNLDNNYEQYGGDFAIGDILAVASELEPHILHRIAEAERMAREKTLRDVLSLCVNAEISQDRARNAGVAAGCSYIAAIIQRMILTPDSADQGGVA